MKHMLVDLWIWAWDSFIDLVKFIFWCWIGGLVLMALYLLFMAHSLGFIGHGYY